MGDVALSAGEKGDQDRRSIPPVDPDTAKPQSREGLMRYRLDELQTLARECRVVYTGLNKAELADRIAEYLSQPFTHKRTVVVTR